MTRYDAVPLLALIREAETRRKDASAYLTIYGHKEGKLAKPLTSMTLAEIQAAQAAWSKNYGSSAAGAYQVLRATLKDLIASMRLAGSFQFTPQLQDEIGYELLRRRGFEDFLAGKINRVQFGKALAQEWASFPVLGNTDGQSRKVERGQSYYAGDGLNRALIAPERVEDVLSIIAAASKPDPGPDQLVPAPAKKPANKAGLIIVALIIIAAIAFFIIKH